MNDLFYFSKKERRGIFVLISLITIVAITPAFYSRYFYTPPKPLISSEELLAVKDSVELSVVKRHSYPASFPKTNKGNNNYKKQPLNSTKDSKIKTTNKSSAATPTYQKSSFIIHDVNTASIEDFQNLNGIGEVLSKRIVNYRDALGGFYSIEQIATTYGLPQETFLKIKPQLKLQSPVKKLNINQLSKNELQNHPYINEKLASQIVNYRNKIAPFKSDKDVLSLYFMDENKFEKLKPYLIY